jgi:phosphoglycolate phosphatase-like HAD superfamily hydrolase
MTRKVAAVLWDIDDCLVDSRGCLIRGQESALRSIGVADADIAAAVALWNRMLWYFRQEDRNGLLLAVAKELGLEQPDRRSLRRACDAFRLPWKSIQPKPDVVDCLAALVEAGCELGAVSNGRYGAQQAKLRIAGLPSYLPRDAVLVVPTTELPSKPNPSSLIECCRRLSVSPRRTVYVGDRTSDVVAANLAGMIPVRLPSHGPEVHEPADGVTLRLETPEVRLTDVRELVPWLTEREMI